MRLVQAGLLLLVAGVLAFSQAPLDNATILKLVKAGIGEDVIIGMVNQQQGRYSLTADDVIALKTGAVSDKVLSAMILRNGTASSMPAAAVATGNAPTTLPSPVTTPQTPHPTDGITRVYIGDSQSWEMRGGWAAGGHTNSDGSGNWVDPATRLAVPARKPLRLSKLSTNAAPASPSPTIPARPISPSSSTTRAGRATPGGGTRLLSLTGTGTTSSATRPARLAVP